MRRKFLILLVVFLGLTPLSVSAPQPPVMPAPPPPPAGSIGYRNDTNMPIIVQGASTTPNGRTLQGPPHQINPNESAVDLISQPGTKIITVYDAQQRVLFKGPVAVAAKDQFFSIQLEMGPDKKVIGAKLVPGQKPR
jgi:hypothetical protein